MTTPYPRSDRATGLALSWCIALVLAPFALAWCMADAAARAVRKFRRVPT